MSQSISHLTLTTSLPESSSLQSRRGQSTLRELAAQLKHLFTPKPRQAKASRPRRQLSQQLSRTAAQPSLQLASRLSTVFRPMRLPWQSRATLLVFTNKEVTSPSQISIFILRISLPMFLKEHSQSMLALMEEATPFQLAAISTAARP